MKERNSSIDAIKGLAILLVMLGHVFVHNHMEDEYIYDVIKAVQMPLFMIISGYLCGAGRKIENFAMYMQVMRKRAIAYLVPFFSWLTLMHPGNVTAAYKTVFFALDYGLWFLAVLFLLTLFVSTAQLAAAGMRRKKNHILSEAVFWGVYGCFCLILLGQCILGNTFLSPSLTLLYVPFYMLGYVTGNYGKKFLCWGTRESGKLDCKYSRPVQAGALLSAAVFLILVIFEDLDSMMTKTQIMVQMIASLLGSLAMIDAVLGWKQGRMKKVLACIGRHTLEIYVVHYHFANILNFQDKQYEFYTPEGVIFVLLSFVVMSVLTYVCIWIMKRIRMVDLLLFGKSSK